MANLVASQARVAAASALATLADVVTLLVLAGALQVGRGQAALAACLVGGVVNFALLRTWLGAAGTTQAPALMAQAARYAVLVVLGGALWSGAIVHAVSTQFALPLLVAKGVAAAVVLVGWSYPMSVFVIFRKEPIHVGL